MKVLAQLYLTRAPLCLRRPDCTDFVAGGPEYKGGLNNTMAAVGSLIDLTITPWGNARQAPVTKTWECQHGIGECMGNTIEACVFHLYPEQEQRWAFALAYEGVAHKCNRTSPGTYPVDAAKAIVDAQGLDWSTISGCFGSFDANGMPPKHSLGYALGQVAATTTNALNPKHTGVPWVTMGAGSSAPPVPDKSIHFPELVCVVCNAYTGKAPKPSACSSCAAPPKPVDCFDKFKTKATCDANPACTWCTSGAVPAACNTLADARSLPPGVFTCDKKLL